MKRPTAYCDRCESTVYSDDVHTRYDAKALREQQERERALNAEERAELLALRTVRDAEAAVVVAAAVKETDAEDAMAAIVRQCNKLWPNADQALHQQRHEAEVARGIAREVRAKAVRALREIKK